MPNSWLVLTKLKAGCGIGVYLFWALSLNMPTSVMKGLSLPYPVVTMEITPSLSSLLAAVLNIILLLSHLLDAFTLTYSYSKLRYVSIRGTERLGHLPQGCLPVSMQTFGDWTQNWPFWSRLLKLLPYPISYVQINIYPTSPYLIPPTARHIYSCIPTFCVSSVVDMEAVYLIT